MLTCPGFRFDFYTGLRAPHSVADDCCLQGDGYRFHLGIELDAFRAELASPAGLVVATQRQLAIQWVVGVDLD